MSMGVSHSCLTNHCNCGETRMRHLATGSLWGNWTRGVTLSPWIGVGAVLDHILGTKKTRCCPEAGEAQGENLPKSYKPSWAPGWSSQAQGIPAST